MSPVDARMLVLASDAERDWDLVVQNLQKAARVDPGGGGPEAAWVALSLAHAYGAFETLLVRLERASGLPERTGATWHRRLLADAARAVPGLRPSLVPAEVEREWGELLGFRHFLHHAYAADLEASKLRPLVESLSTAVAATEPLVREALRVLREP